MKELTKGEEVKSLRGERLLKTSHCEESRRLDAAIQARFLKSRHPELDSGSYQQEPVVFNYPSLRGGQSPLSYLDNGSGQQSSLRAGSAGVAIQSTHTTGSVKRTGLLRHFVPRNDVKPTLKLFTASPLKLAGFTMAEILLSLTIIGVVAAITLPSLTGNINERTWDTQRKALYSRMSQAISLMPALSGYGTLNATTDTAAETFVTSGLAKVLKINNICANDSISDCGFPTRIVSLNASTIDTPTTMSALNSKMLYGNEYSGGFSYYNSKAAAFETQNGESILAFYNPLCQPSKNETYSHYTQPKICVNFIFDLNGKKGPNTVSKDIGFMSALYPTDSSVVAPNVTRQRASITATQEEALSACREQDEEYRIPSQDELSSMFANQLLMNGEITSVSLGYWSSTLKDSTHAWDQGFQTGARIIYPRSTTMNVHCVKR